MASDNNNTNKGNNNDHNNQPQNVPVRSVVCPPHELSWDNNNKNYGCVCGCVGGPVKPKARKANLLIRIWSVSCTDLHRGMEFKVRYYHKKGTHSSELSNALFTFGYGLRFAITNTFLLKLKQWHVCVFFFHSIWNHLQSRKKGENWVKLQTTSQSVTEQPNSSSIDEAKLIDAYDRYVFSLAYVNFLNGTRGLQH